jgi:hypothetical protein
MPRLNWVSGASPVHRPAPVRDEIDSQCVCRPKTSHSNSTDTVLVLDLRRFHSPPPEVDNKLPRGFIASVAFGSTR